MDVLDAAVTADHIAHAIFDLVITGLAAYALTWLRGQYERIKLGRCIKQAAGVGYLSMINVPASDASVARAINAGTDYLQQQPEASVLQRPAAYRLVSAELGALLAGHKVPEP